MPRDLSKYAEAMKEDTIQGMQQLTREQQNSTDPELTKSPEEVEEGSGPQGFTLAEEEDAMFRSLAERNERRDELHPYTQTLNLSDVDSCTVLEEEVFPPNERCTREKVSRESTKQQP